MSKYSITHTCGHTSEHTLFGKHSGFGGRDSKIECLETQPCLDCVRAKEARKRDEQNAAAAETYETGSLAYCDIANDEGGKVCCEFETESATSNELYEKFCGKSADGVEWPENGTEEEIRSASREDWEKKLTAAGYTREN
jgi:hypothetical protein